MVTRDGDRRRSQTFCVGAFAFAVETAADEDHRLVESLFRDVPSPTDGAAPRPSTLSLLRADADGDTWIVRSPRSDDRTTAALDIALDLLVADINLCALDAEPDRLHLHAAAAVADDRAVVIAAERNTGKTTTVAHLAARGWGFVTDETVRLSECGNDISGFPKPLSIKPDGVEHVAHLTEWMIPHPADGPAVFRFVPVGQSGADRAEGGRAHLVVLLQ